MSNLNMKPGKWLSDMFRYNYCDYCGGDMEHHTAVPVLGNWFARCDFPPREEDGEKCHPMIEDFRSKAEGREK